MAAALELTALHPAFGAEVRGVQLSSASGATLQAIAEALDTHRLLLFRSQETLRPEDQLRVSRSFGALESTFYKHPRSPHPDIFRVSNDESEGCTHVGRSGWHIDGSFLPRAFDVMTMHFTSVLSGGRGATMFAPLREVVQRLEAAEGVMAAPGGWRGLGFVATRSHHGGCEHALVYPHPRTGEDTMFFHLGRSFLRTFSRRGGAEGSGRYMDEAELASAVRLVQGHLEDPALCLRLEWRAGDFALVDNCALAHYAEPDTQLPRCEAGLRILHRTTVRRRPQ